MRYAHKQYFRVRSHRNIYFTKGKLLEGRIYTVTI
jgi:hypothetical protein